MPIRIDDNIREQIRVDYIQSGSINMVRKKYKVSWATVNNIISEAPDELEEQRRERRKEFIEGAWDVAQMYLEKLKDPKSVKDAKPRDAAIIYGVLVDKMQREKELYLRFDEVWSQVYSALRDELKDELRQHPDIIKSLVKITEDNENKIKEKTREKVIKHKAEIIEKIKNDSKRISKSGSSIERDNYIEIAKEVAIEIATSLMDEDDD